MLQNTADALLLMVAVAPPPIIRQMSPSASGLTPHWNELDNIYCLCYISISIVAAIMLYSYWILKITFHL